MCSRSSSDERSGEFAGKKEKSMTTTTDDRAAETPGQIAPVVPTPIDWHSVALVVFHNDKPVIISSAEPHVIVETLIEAAMMPREADQDNDMDYEYENQRERFETKAERMREYVNGLRWELYSLEDAKAVFSAGYGK